MPALNQIHFTDAWNCIPCQREFTTVKGIHAHCKSIHAGCWCSRCSWLFVSGSALDDHLKASNIHWVCYEEGCSDDYVDQESLDRHQEEDHAVCIPCWTHFELKDGKPNHAGWRKHQVDKHHMCDICGRRFDNENSQLQHKKTHDARNKSCFGCPRKFMSYSAMMIHLEAGTCDRPFDIGDIDRWTAQCLTSRIDVKGYTCDNCKDGDDEQPVFRCLSALLQHQESPSCSGKLSHDVEQMLKFIAVRVRLLPYPSGQALAILAKLYVDNSGSFLEQLKQINEAAPMLPVEKLPDGRIRTIVPSSTLSRRH